MDEIPGKVGESLREHRDDALLSRRLAEIPTDLPVPFEPETLQRREPDLETLREHLLGARVLVARRRDPGRGRGAPPAAPSRRLARRRGLLDAPRTATAGRRASRRGGATSSSPFRTAARREIAEEPSVAIVERWARDRPARVSRSRSPTPSRSTRSSRARGPRSAADVFDVGLAQYVLATGVASAEIDADRLPRGSARGCSPDKDAGVAAARSRRATRSAAPTAGSRNVPRLAPLASRRSRAELARGRSSRGSIARSSGR